MNYLRWENSKAQLNTAIDRWMHYDRMRQDFSQQVWPGFYAVDDVNTMIVVKVIIIKVIIDSNTAREII
jgi:hypothetical protein